MEKWKYVGTRYPLESPTGHAIEMHVVQVNHPNGPWEAIYCKTKEQAVLIAAAPDLLEAIERLLIWRQSATPVDLLEQAETAIAKARGAS